MEGETRDSWRQNGGRGEGLGVAAGVWTAAADPPAAEESVVPCPPAERGLRL